MNYEYPFRYHSRRLLSQVGGPGFLDRLVGWRLQGGKFQVLCGCSWLWGTAVLNAIIEISRVLRILCSTANNTCPQRLILSAQEPFAHTIPFNHIGCIELMRHLLTDR